MRLSFNNIKCHSKNDKLIQDSMYWERLSIWRTHSSYRRWLLTYLVQNSRSNWWEPKLRFTKKASVFLTRRNRLSFYLDQELPTNYSCICGRQSWLRRLAWQFKRQHNFSIVQKSIYRWDLLGLQLARDGHLRYSSDLWLYNWGKWSPLDCLHQPLYGNNTDVLCFG